MIKFRLIKIRNFNQYVQRHNPVSHNAPCQRWQLPQGSFGEHEVIVLALLGIFDSRIKLKLVLRLQTDGLDHIYIARLVRFRIPPGQVVLALTSNYSAMAKLQTGGRVQQRVVKVNIPRRHWVWHRRPCRTLSINFGNGAVAVDLEWKGAKNKIL